MNSRLAGAGALGIALGVATAGCSGGEMELPTRHDRYGVFRDLVLIARSDARGGPFFLDRFEVSRREMAQWFAETHRLHPPAWPSQWLRADADDPGQQRPAVRVDLVTARAFAAWRFCRLPTAGEWEHAATGGNAYRFPWGDHSRVEWANTPALGLGQTTAIGTFESGRSPGGPYDLLGNVAEWTESLPVDFLRDVAAWARYSPLRALGREGYVPLLACVAAAPRQPARLVVGGGFVGIADAVAPRARDQSPLLACQPHEWSDTTGLRLAIDPRGLLLRLLREVLPPTESETRLLTEFLAQPAHRAVLVSEWAPAVAQVAHAGPLLPVLATALRP